MRTLLLAAALALATGAGCSKTDKSDATAKADDVPTMTVDELAAALDAKQATPVDCNSERTRKKLGVVPGAIAISDEEEFGPSELPADKTTKLVFYCADPG